MDHIKLPSIALVLGAIVLAGCASPQGSTTTPTGGTDIVRGDLKQAGSSTVFPIAEAWAEELAPRGLQVAVAGGGSGAGASKLCAKEVDIGDLSRRIKQSEIDLCKANGVTPEEWTVAYDGLTIVVSSKNTFVDELTVDQLKQLWASGSTVQTWADLRADWPATPIKLYGPDSDSGTYEYFVEEVLGKTCGADKKQLCPPRSDHSASAEDTVLVEGVSASEDALGYFGYAYYFEAKDRLRAVPIVAKGSTTAVEPSFETIRSGTYTPFSRPIFMYTNGIPADGTPLHSYFEYAYAEGQDLIEEVGYVPLEDTTLAAMKAKL